MPWGTARSGRIHTAVQRAAEPGPSRLPRRERPPDGVLAPTEPHADDAYRRVPQPVRATTRPISIRSGIRPACLAAQAVARSPGQVPVLPVRGDQAPAWPLSQCCSRQAPGPPGESERLHESVPSRLSPSIQGCVSTSSGVQDSHEHRTSARGQVFEVPAFRTAALRPPQGTIPWRAGRDALAAVSGAGKFTAVNDKGPA